MSSACCGYAEIRGCSFAQMSPEIGENDLMVVHRETNLVRNVQGRRQRKTKKRKFSVRSWNQTNDLSFHVRSNYLSTTTTARRRVIILLKNNRNFI